jgi:protease-4
MSNAEGNAPPARRVRWGLLIILVVAALLILGGVLMIAGLASLAKGKTVMIKPASTLVLSLDRPLQEPQPDPFLAQFFHAKAYCVYDLTTALDRAAKDDRISSLLLDVSAAPAGVAKLEEVREAVERFKASKKPVWAYFEATGTGGYFVASAAQKVCTPPTGNLMLVGPVAELPFFRGVLDKLKIEPQLYHIGAYKSYSDTFTRKDPSDAQKEATDAILDSLYGQLTGAIAKGRNLAPEKVRAAMDRSYWVGREIRDLGLADDLLYKDQVEEALKKVNGNEDRWHRVAVADYIYDHRVDLAEGAKKSLALVLASGGIVSGESEPSGPFGSDNMGSDTVVRWLRQAGENDAVAAVVFRVDSPGGSGLASDMIWRQVEVLRKTKPVVVSMSDVAGSGGYYIAMGADGIVAQPGTITGSIGVVSGKFVVKGLLDYIGYNEVTLKRGENSDIFNGYNRFTPEQEKLVQDQMAVFYRDFVTKVAQGRKSTYEAVDRIAQGRIWSGEDAVKLGLADRLGGIHEAVAMAKEKAKLRADEPVRIVIYPKPKSFFESLLRGAGDELAQARTLAALPPELRRAYREYEALKPLAAQPFAAYEPVRVRM